MEIIDCNTFIPNKEGYKVETPDGWLDFAGIDVMGEYFILRLEFENGYWIECSENHKFFKNNYEIITAKDIKIDDIVLSDQGEIKLIEKIDTGRIERVYDLIEVDNTHRYFTNGVVSSNCRFVSFDMTLINPMFLSDMQPGLVVEKVGEIRFFKEIEPNKIYVIGVDPALGVGGNPTAIEVFCLPEMEQVAEWTHNKTPIPTQVRVLYEMCNIMYNRMRNHPNQIGEPEIYFSLENNTYGESFINGISDIGEDKFKAEFISEQRSSGHGVVRRQKGFNTNVKSKATSCAKLKSLIENGKMIVNSLALITELKFFVSQGQSFAAKSGETDDLVSATLIVVRIVEMLRTWDTDINARLRDSGGFEEVPDIEPMYVSVLF